MPRLTRRAASSRTARWRVLAGAAAGLAGAATSPALAQQPEERPNVIVVVADDLAPEWVGFLDGKPGNALTPTLDRLAGEGVVLTNFHSPSPICTPSRFALLTGGYPSRAVNEEFEQATLDNGGQTSVTFNTHLVAGQNNLARRLRDAGYATAAVGKNHVVDVPGYAKIPYKASLDDPKTQRKLAANAEAVADAFHEAGFDYAASLYYGNPDADGIKALAAHNQDWVTQGAIDFLDAKPADKPFFLYMATTIPHGPFEDDRGWNGDRHLTANGLLDEPPATHVTSESIKSRLDEAGVKGWNAANVLWLDDAMADLMNELDKTGDLDHTTLIFLSDHGTRSKGSVYDGGTRTVGFVWRKDGFALSKTDAMLSLMDIAPTVLSWAGASYQPSDFDGADMTPVLEGEADEIRDAMFFEVGFTRAVMKDGLKYVELRYPPRAEAMTKAERKAELEEQIQELTDRGRPIPTRDPMAPFSHLFLMPGGVDAEQVAIRHQPGYFDPDQLYDLAADPTEQENVVDDPAYADRLAELRGLLADHLNEMPGTFGEGDVDAVAAGITEEAYR